MCPDAMKNVSQHYRNDWNSHCISSLHNLVVNYTLQMRPDAIENAERVPTLLAMCPSTIEMIGIVTTLAQSTIKL